MRLKEVPGRDAKQLMEISGLIQVYHNRTGPGSYAHYSEWTNTIIKEYNKPKTQRSNQDKPTKNMEEKIKELFYGIAIIIFVYFLIGLTNYAVDKIEKAECLTWQKEALDHRDYYLLKWQKAQCDSWAIVVPAEIK